MPDIFDEVEEDLRADRARVLLRRYGPYGIAAAVLLLLGTAIGVWWQDRRHAEDQAAAATFLTATRTATPDGPLPAGGDASLARVAATAPGGYPTLARLRLAADDFAAGRRTDAHALWGEIAADRRAPALLRDLAELTDIQHSLDDADPAALQSRLLPLIAPENPWRPLAEQTEALLDLRQNRRDQAVAILKRLSTDLSAPQGVRQMSGSLLQAVGEQGAHS